MIIPAILMAAIVYACEISILSIGFTLTYLTAKIPNFAHGTYAGVGIYISFTLAKVLNISPYIGLPISFLLGGAISIVIYVLVIGVVDRMGGGAIVLTISTLAIQIFLTGIIYIYAYWLRDTYRTYAMGFLLKQNDFEWAGLPGIFFVSLGLCIFTVITLHYFLTQTKTGIAMRATSEDPELASVLGINTNRIQIISWFMTGGLACLAGTMLPMWFMCTPASGAAIITSIMAGSLLGGFENIYGAIVGGFSVGFSEILLTTWLQKVVGVWVGEYRPLIPMILLVAVLLIEPRGIQGLYERFLASSTGEKIIMGITRSKE